MVLGDEVEFQDFQFIWHRGTVTGFPGKKVQVDFRQSGEWRRVQLPTKRVRRYAPETSHLR